MAQETSLVPRPRAKNRERGLVVFPCIFCWPYFSKFWRANQIAEWNHVECDPITCARGQKCQLCNMAEWLARLCLRACVCVCLCLISQWACQAEVLMCDIYQDFHIWELHPSLKWVSSNYIPCNSSESTIRHVKYSFFPSVVQIPVASHWCTAHASNTVFSCLGNDASGFCWVHYPVS